MELACCCSPLWDKPDCRDPVRRTSAELRIQAPSNSRNDVERRDTTRALYKIAKLLFPLKREKRGTTLVQSDPSESKVGSKELIRLHRAVMRGINCKSESSRKSLIDSLGGL